MEQSNGARADAGRRYRASPTPEQAGRLTGWGHSCRAVWNLALEQRQYLYRHRGVTLRANAQGVQLTQARGELPWLADLPAQAAQQVLRQLDRAYDNWWNPQHPADAPTFRKRSTGLAVPFPGQAVNVRKLNRKWAEVRLPKVGWVRFRLSRPPPADFGMARVTLDRAGRWHVPFAAPQPPVARRATGRAAGVDRGVTTTLVDSNGQHHRAPTSPRLYATSDRLSRRLARQRRGSRRRAHTGGSWDGPTPASPTGAGLGGEGLHPAGRRQRRGRARAAADQGPVGPPPGPARSRPAWRTSPTGRPPRPG